MDSNNFYDQEGSTTDPNVIPKTPKQIGDHPPAEPSLPATPPENLPVDSTASIQPEPVLKEVVKPAEKHPSKALKILFIIVGILVFALLCFWIARMF